MSQVSSPVGAPIPGEEERRLEVLRAYRVLDTAPEEAFDRITRVAADLFDVPIALVSLVDKDRQWFKSCIGLGVAETGRDVSFCAHAILSDDVLVVPDAAVDERFATNPLVTGEAHIRFYAGAPLMTPEGVSLGTLCLVDTEPRPGFSSHDRGRLEIFAALVVDLLQLRIGALDLRAEVRQREEAEREIALQRTLTELLQVVSSAANNSDTIEEAAYTAIREVCSRLRWPLGHLFLRDRERMVSGGIWYAAEEERFASFREATEANPLTEGEGLAGMVLREGAYVFTTIPPAKQVTGRVEAGRASGLEAAAGFPILVGGEIAGVLEFFLTDPARPDEETLQTMAQIGTQLGRVVERARARDELLASQQLAAAQAEAASRLAAIVQTSSDAIIGKTLEGRVTSWNAAAERMYGYTANEMIGRSIQQIVPERRRGEVPAILDKLRAGQAITSFETTRVRKDGTEIPVSVSISPVRGPGGDIVAAATIARDISVQKRTEAEKRRSEAFRGAILSSIAEAVVVSDADDRIVLINPSMEHLGGWTLDEVRGGYRSDVYRPVDQRGEPVTEEHPRFTELFEESDGTLRSRGYDISLVTASGAEVPVSWTVAPIRDGAQEMQGWVAVLRDVSREREVDQLKSSLVSTVSHELRTPLTMIQGFSELMLERDMDRDKEVQALGQIHTSAERLARLIDDLLSVSRIESGSVTMEIEPNDLNVLVQEVVATFRASGRELQVELEAGLPQVMADADMTTQILTNLVSNAIKYSPGGGPIRVDGRSTDDEVEVTVTDHGLGLTQEQLDKLFQKFFRADSSDVRKISGTGLGLFITKKLVELQGGRMRVTSEFGLGSAFSFTLPAAVLDLARQGEDEVVPI